MEQSNKKLTLEDIFKEDEFGLLESVAKVVPVKNSEQRLIESFEEINVFIDKNERLPEGLSMTEYSLQARLKNIRLNEQQKVVLKPFDRHNLLGEVKIPATSIEDILNDDDLGLLAADGDLSIFKYKHLPKEDEREKADFIAQRKPMDEEEFKPYELMFQKVHQEINEGLRNVKPFHNIEKNLHVGNFYILDGLMLYLKEADLKNVILKGESIERLEGRTFTIFENCTYSNMLYRSLGKQIQRSGKLITNTDANVAYELFVNSGAVNEADTQTGWIYVLKSKSTHPEIAGIKNLYKIGYSTQIIDDRIKNARNEATYLYADVMKVSTYACFNRNADRLEQLLHRFFAEACLNIDIEVGQGKRVAPREWFVVPFEEIEKAISLILKERIIHYKYDRSIERIVLK